MKHRFFTLIVAVAIFAHGELARAACDAGGVCAACAKDSQCDADQFCEAQTNTCAAKLADGTPLPVGDSCDAITAARECVTGQCDPASNECGPPAIPKPFDAGTITTSTDAGTLADAASSVLPEDAGPSFEVSGGGCDVSANEDGTGKIGLFAFATASVIALSLTSRRKKSTTR